MTYKSISRLFLQKIPQKNSSAILIKKKMASALSKHTAHAAKYMQMSEVLPFDGIATQVHSVIMRTECIKDIIFYLFNVYYFFISFLLLCSLMLTVFMNNSKSTLFMPFLQCPQLWSLTAGSCVAAGRAYKNKIKFTLLRWFAFQTENPF